MIKKINISDLRTGMFVSKVHSTWLRSPIMMSNFMINSSKDINRLKSYDIAIVSIDTSKGLDIAGPGEITVEVEDDVFKGNMFDVALREFAINRPIPVDFYQKKAGQWQLIMRKGLSYTEEVREMFSQGGIRQVAIPETQKQDYDKYKFELEKEVEEQRKQGYDGVFTDPAKVESYLNFMENYHTINVASLVEGVRPGFDIFRRDNGNLYLVNEKNENINGKSTEIWAKEKANLLLLKKDINLYQSYLLEHTKNSKSVRTKITFVLENSKILVEDLAKNPRSGKLMKQTKVSVADLTRMVIENPTTFYGLTKINNYDYYTFTHSVNVSTFSLALAMTVGVNSKEDLSDLGLGCILHDVGKAKVENRLINKPGKLTPEEYRKVKSHVLLGYEWLKDNDDIPEQAMIPLLQHHEKLSGAGYPYGLSGDEIHIFGRIASIMDIYDALTTERSYKKAFKPFDALTLISKQESDFDKDVFYAFVKLIHEQET